MPNETKSARTSMPKKIDKKGVVGKYGSIDGYEKYSQSMGKDTIPDKKMEGNVTGQIRNNMDTARISRNNQTTTVDSGRPNSSPNTMKSARK